MKSIIKRDGKEMPFDESKIFNAIYAANKAVDGEKMTSIDFTYLTKKVVEQLDGETCTVEQVQDIVEAMLIKYDWEKTAKAYILYRAEHAKIREAESDLMNIYNELTYSYSKDADIKRENANIDGDTSMGTMLKYGSEGAKYFVDNYVLPKDIAKAHINGDIHIHDKDFYMLPDRPDKAFQRRILHRTRLPQRASVDHELRFAGMHRDPGKPERDARRTVGT